jgi:hypothetical protein
MTNNNNLRDAWDVITATLDGGVIWRRYRDGKIVVTRGDESPEQVAARKEAEHGARDSNTE